ncbi:MULTISPECIES: hypothetical protein [unclassified Streptomyces]
MRSLLRVAQQVFGEGRLRFRQTGGRPARRGGRAGLWSRRLKPKLR